MRSSAASPGSPDPRGCRIHAVMVRGIGMAPPPDREAIGVFGHGDPTPWKVWAALPIALAAVVRTEPLLAIADNVPRDPVQGFHDRDLPHPDPRRSA